MSDTLAVKIRPYEAGDEAMLVHSWLESYHDVPTVAWAPRGTWLRIAHDRIEAALADPKSTVLVACNPESPSQIFGWLCGEGYCLHYVYVKLTYRGLGIARGLVEEWMRDAPRKSVVVSHWAGICEDIKSLECVYRPGEWWTKRQLVLAKARHAKARYPHAKAQ